MDTSTLAKLTDVDGPVVTIYLDTHADVENAEAQLDTRWKNLLRDLGNAGVDDKTQEALTAARGTVGDGGTRVLVAAGGEVQLASSLPEPPPRDEMTVAALPRLVPLIDSLTLAVPFVLVLADRSGADVYGYANAAEQVESDQVTSDRFPSHKVKFGGPGTKRFSNDVEQSWEQSAKDVAHSVELVARDINPRRIIASGDAHALSLLHQHLPADLAEHYVTIAGGGRAVDGGDAAIAEAIEAVLADTVTGDTTDLLEQFAQERGRAGLAADGYDATIAAARMGAIDTLILTDLRDESVTGFFGPEPSQLARTAEDVVSFGAPSPREASLVEILVRAAIATDSAIRVVGGGMEQSPTDGIGALLRFPVDPVAAS